MKTVYDGRNSTSADIAKIHSLQEQYDKATAYQELTKEPLELTEATQHAMQEIQNHAEALHLDGNALLQQIGAIFSKYEISFGWLKQLYEASQKTQILIIDDSGSMGAQTDILLQHAVEPLRSALAKRSISEVRFKRNERMTRWEEAQNRIHMIIDTLALFPDTTIHLQFLNDRDTIVLKRAPQEEPEAFRVSAHNTVLAKFEHFSPNGGTPLVPKLKQAFAHPGTVNIIVFNDGVPNNEYSNGKMVPGRTAAAASIRDRSQPHNHSLILVPCTSKPADVEWMNDADGVPAVAIVDDYLTEKNQVLSSHGPGISYQLGDWIVCSIAAASNPNDLDATDENLPYTKKTYESYIGRVVTPLEYMQYFQNNPNGRVYQHLFSRFILDNATAREIVSKQEQTKLEIANGYIRSEENQQVTYARPRNLPLADLTALVPHVLFAAGLRFAELQHTTPPPSYSQAVGLSPIYHQILPAYYQGYYQMLPPPPSYFEATTASVSPLHIQAPTSQAPNSTMFKTNNNTTPASTNMNDVDAYISAQDKGCCRIS